MGETPMVLFQSAQHGAACIDPCESMPHLWLIFFQGSQLLCKTVKSAELDAGWVVVDGRA
jgi:hypothetical protein